MALMTVNNHNEQGKDHRSQPRWSACSRSRTPSSTAGAPSARTWPVGSACATTGDLHGLSGLDFVPALEAFFGASAGLSASVVTPPDLPVAGRAADVSAAGPSRPGLRVLLGRRDPLNLRLEDGRLCCLVIVGVCADGTKEPVAVADGQRESTDDWAELLCDLRRRGTRAPVIMVGDGALGAVAGTARGVPGDPRTTVLGP